MKHLEFHLATLALSCVIGFGYAGTDNANGVLVSLVVFVMLDLFGLALMYKRKE